MGTTTAAILRIEYALIPIEWRCTVRKRCHDQAWGVYLSSGAWLSKEWGPPLNVQSVNWGLVRVSGARQSGSEGQVAVLEIAQRPPTDPAKLPRGRC